MCHDKRLLDCRNLPTLLTHGDVCAHPKANTAHAQAQGSSFEPQELTWLHEQGVLLRKLMILWDKVMASNLPPHIER